MPEKKVVPGDLSEGCCLTRAVLSSDGKMLLKEGSVLTLEEIDLLSLYKVQDVFIDENSLGLSAERKKRLDVLFSGLEGYPLMMHLKEYARRFLIKHREEL